MFIYNLNQTYRKLKRGQRVIEENEDKLQKEEIRRDNARAKTDQTKRLLVQIKSDIEHLANKVHHLKAVNLLIMTFLSNIMLQLQF